MLPTFKEVNDLLEYDPATGVLRWRVYRGRLAKPGFMAGTFDGTGYMQVRINGRKYMLHRVVFLLMTGEWPTKHVDHINGMKGDNRWANLRECDRSQNQGNKRKLLVTNTTGFRGVTREGKKFLAQLQVAGEGCRRLGLYGTAEEAYAAYSKAARAYFGEFFHDLTGGDCAAHTSD